ncbi:cuticle protein 14 isoform b [Trichonephila inaurata madagascariensis]|uniref:Cuticle protein 14 isoform b n=1 Tax=Trichonephila inaurata madagascariensis TaxID=2747483 RepID=A0A8X6YH69_9ARAC|nr:cuticle protein 14 isoform b [Trichonephila inaurata madagascariensis]
MQVLVFCALFALSHATALYSAPAVIHEGKSKQYSSRDDFGNYNFGYNEDHYSGGSFRKEAGDAYGNKFGSYGIQQADGRSRIVSYVADAKGFRADIKTNEPGVEPKDSAAATYNKGSFAATYSAPETYSTYSAPTTSATSSAPATYSASYSAPATYSAPISYSAPAIPTSYAVATAPAKTYISTPTTYSYSAYAPTTYKTYAPAPSTFAYSYASAPVKTYATSTLPISYSTSYKSLKAEPAPVFTYANAPAPYNTYAPVRFFSGPAIYKQTSY